jgi:O-antigen/teichoic acid export membrane protein
MDNLIVGKLLGLTALGYYAMAYRWGNMFPLDIGKIVNQVLYPVNVKYQDNIPMLEKIQKQSLKYVSLIIFPISFGFAIVCPEFVNVVLGEKWVPSVIPLQIMSVHGLFWGLSKRGNLFVALGKPKYISFQALLFILLLAISIFPMTASMGINGTAIAVLVSVIVSFVAFWVILHKVWDFKVKRILSKIVIPFVSSLIMLAVIYSFKTFQYNLAYSQLTVLMSSILIGLVTYSLCIILFMYADVRKVVCVFVKRDITTREKFRTILTNM